MLISSRFGDIRIDGWDQDKVEAEASGGAGDDQIEAKVVGETSRQRVFLNAGRLRRDDGVVIVKVPRYAEVETLEGTRGDISVTGVEGAVRIGSGHGDVKVLRVGALKVLRRGGDISVRDVKGRVEAKNAQGDVDLENVGESVDVAIASGDLRIRKAGGDVRVNAAAGDIDIGCVKGRAEVSTASGSVTLAAIEGDVAASTASGDVSLTGALRPDGTYRLRSISGEVQAVIPADTRGFTATLISYSGALSTDFPIKPDSPIADGPMNRKITGSFGDGSAKLTLDSFSGEVRIVKGKPGAIKGCQ